MCGRPTTLGAMIGPMIVSPPPYYARVTFTHPAPAHARVALHLPPCQPRAGINTDWSGDKCAMLHKSSSYALLPSPPAQLLASPSARAMQTPVLQPPQPQALLPALPAQPSLKPAAEPVTMGQATHAHVPEPAMANLGFDVAVALFLAVAFAVVRRFILNFIEPPRRSPEHADMVEHETRR
jgi:hypothetical protein